MNCTANGCSGECLQGRLCETSFMATRRVMGLTDEQKQLFESRQGGALIQDGHEIADDFLYAEKTAGTAFEMLVGLILCVVLVPLLLWLSLTV
jgi:hypothetical protein